MRWLIFLVSVAGCSRHLSGTDDGRATPTGNAIRTTSAATDGGVDFLCPSQPLNDGSACAMPPDQRCKYFVGGSWLCLVCDKTGHWLVVHC